MTRLYLVLLALLLAGCGEIPKDALTGYTESFRAAHDASDAFLVQFGQTKQEAESFIQAREEPSNLPFKPYPDVLPAHVPNGDAIDPDVEAMRLGFEVISRYNAALVALADDKAPEAVGASVSGLIAALGDFVPVAGTVAGAVGSFATELERARRRGEFRQALDSGAPTVREILTLIAANVETDYDSNVKLADNARTLIASEIVDRVTELQGVFSTCAAPAGASTFTALDDRQAALDGVLEPLSKELGIATAYPYPLAFNPAGTPYTAESEAVITALALKIAEMVVQYEAIIARVNALARSSAAYRQMLNVTQRSLTALEQADDAPPDLTQQAAELLRLAFLIKTHVEEIRAARVGA